MPSDTPDSGPDERLSNSSSITCGWGFTISRLMCWREMDVGIWPLGEENEVSAVWLLWLEENTSPCRLVQVDPIVILLTWF